MKQNDKLDKMLKNYCDRDTQAFEFKEKKPNEKITSLIAACLVVVLLLSVFIVPEFTNKNDFTLTASAASKSELSAFKTSYEIIPFAVSLKVRGEDIKEIYAYTENEHYALAVTAWSREYNLVGYDARLNGDVKNIDMPTLLVTPYVKTADGKLVIAINATENNEYVSHLKVLDESETQGEKYINITSIPIDENKKVITDENSAKKEDKIIVEVTYLDGTTQIQSKDITYDNNNMIVDSKGDSFTITPQKGE